MFFQNTKLYRRRSKKNNVHYNRILKINTSSFTAIQFISHYDIQIHFNSSQIFHAVLPTTPQIVVILFLNLYHSYKIKPKQIEHIRKNISKNISQ